MLRNRILHRLGLVARLGLQNKLNGVVLLGLDALRVLGRHSLHSRYSRCTGRDSAWALLLGL